MLLLVKNSRVSIIGTLGGMVLRCKVEPGGDDKSYGIEVAKLAGLPVDVIRRAREVLIQHEGQERQSARRLEGHEERQPSSVQLAIFTPLSQQIVDRLKEVDVNRLTPIEALTLLDELKKQLD